MNAVAHALAEMAPYHPRFALSMGGLGAFPGLRRPRVIWLGLKAAPELLGLQSAVESAMTDLGYPLEDRAWSPHLTLGRAEERARAADFAGLETMAHDITYRATVDINSVDLMRSHLERGGARYERIAAFPLRATNPVEPAK
jgi:2'-5' RNA ligase